MILLAANGGLLGSQTRRSSGDSGFLVCRFRVQALRGVSVQEAHKQQSAASSGPFMLTLQTSPSRRSLRGILNIGGEPC